MKVWDGGRVVMLYAIVHSKCWDSLYHWIGLAQLAKCISKCGPPHVQHSAFM